MNLHRKTDSGADSGSIMVWILVAVGLFAALSFVVSGNMRSGSPDVMSVELAKNYGTDILQFSASLRRAVQSMKIDGTADTEISFENPTAAGYANGNCANSSCKIFSPRGGGLNYVIPNPEWLDITNQGEDHYGAWLFTGSACIAGVGTGDTDCETDADTGTEELLAIMPYIKKNICVELNKKLGINLPSGEPLEEGGGAWESNPANARFTGSYVNNSEIGDSAAEYNGKRSGCFEGSGANTPPAGTYHYFEVLLAR